MPLGIKFAKCTMNFSKKYIIQIYYSPIVYVMMNKFDGKWGSGRWEKITRVGELINLAKYREKFNKLAPNLQDFF